MIIARALSHPQLYSNDIVPVLSLSLSLISVYHSLAWFFSLSLSFCLSPASYDIFLQSRMQNSSSFYSISIVVTRPTHTEK